MQASELWAGHDYAYARFGRPRGDDTPDGCMKVTVVRVFKQKADSWSERMSTYAEVRNDSGQLMTIPARQIVDFWDEYQMRVEARRQEREERQREWEEQRAKAEQQRTEVALRIGHAFGVEPFDVTLYSGTVALKFARKDLFKVIGMEESGD